MTHTLTPPASPPAPTGAAPVADRRTLTRVCTAVLLGSALEWYEHLLYGAAAALVFGHVFFPSASDSTSLLLSLATFGVGFVARPIGAMVFGHIGDKHGRRPALIATLMLMGLSTTAMALIPSHAMIGTAAPVLLVVLRLLQGIGFGTVHSGASVYAVEYAPPVAAVSSARSPPPVSTSAWCSRRARCCFAGHAQFAAWGWRLPFLASMLLIALGLWIRLRLGDARVRGGGRRRRSRAGAAAHAGCRQWRSMLLATGLVAAPRSFSDLYQRLRAVRHGRTHGYDRVTGTTGLLSPGWSLMITAPLAGIASDRSGRCPAPMVGRGLRDRVRLPVLRAGRQRTAGARDASRSRSPRAAASASCSASQGRDPVRAVRARPRRLQRCGRQPRSSPRSIFGGLAPDRRQPGRLGQRCPLAGRACDVVVPGRHPTFVSAPLAPETYSDEPVRRRRGGAGARGTTVPSRAFLGHPGEG